MTQDAERDFDELASVVAHELNTPLAVISSAASLLERDPDREQDPDEAQAILDTIRRNVELAQLVVEGMRGRHVDGRDLQLERQPTELTELARHTISDLAGNVLADHDPQVEGDRAVVAQVDPLRVRQILFNLLSNAAKFSPPGREIRVVVSAVDDGKARILVRDRGHGVAPGDVERIFDKWTRADADTTGLGLGLHLSRAIARAHGGDLRLEEPDDGQGAIFVLELPR